MKPNRCAAYPGLGPRHEKGYVVLGFLPGFDNDAIASVEALQNIAKNIPQAGLALAADLAARDAEIERKDAEIADLRSQIEKLEQEQGAIDLLARKDGQYIKQKRTGRPPAEKKNSKPKAAAGKGA